MFSRMAETQVLKQLIDVDRTTSDGKLFHNVTVEFAERGIFLRYDCQTDYKGCYKIYKSPAIRSIVTVKVLFQYFTETF